MYMILRAKIKPFLGNNHQLLLCTPLRNCFHPIRRLARNYSEKVLEARGVFSYDIRGEGGPAARHYAQFMLSSPQG